MPKINRTSVPVATDGSEAMAGNLPPKVLPGEKNYLQAITLLTEAIEANGETSLKPTLLADYKMNLAVVDEAITATQRTARTNPKRRTRRNAVCNLSSKLDLFERVADHPSFIAEVKKYVCFYHDEINYYISPSPLALLERAVVAFCAEAER